MLIAKYKFDNTLSDCFPTFNEGFIYTYTDEVNGTVTTRTIESDDDFTSCSFNGKMNLLSVEYLKVTDKVTDMSAMFAYCSNLTSLDLSGFDTANVTNMNSMFYYCSGLTSLDLSNFNTAKVINMGYMFIGCSSLITLDVSSFDTSKVTRMDTMFAYCSNLTSLDLSGFDTAKVTVMVDMFYDCYKIKEIGLIYANIDTINDISGQVPQATIFINENLDTSAYTGTASLKVYKEFATTVTLTTSLKKVGDKTDRLYWDDTDKCYYIEQWIDPNMNTVLSTPNKIASAISLPINMKVFDSETSICTLNCEPSYMKCTVPYFDIPNDYEYNEADELEYIKQSFELRHPDEDDVAEDWGFMGAEERVNCVDYYNFTGISNFVLSGMPRDGRHFITVETETGCNYGLSISNENKEWLVNRFRGSGESYYFEDNEQYFSVLIPNYENISYILVDGVKYVLNKEWENELDMPMAYVDVVLNPEYGLKALIDWVDNCTDEEFVADFEEHFHKDYTLRYFCLVTLIGAVDNLG